MDFANRSTQPVNTRSNGANDVGVRSRVPNRGKLIKVGAVVLLLCIVALVASLVLLFNFGDNSESKYVKSDKLQSVFLNNGQVYFGNIKSLNDKYVDLTNIYYLRTNSTGAAASSTANSNDVSLVKLGCELHGPTDEMLINRDQVTFWENLQSTGQVAKAVASYKQQNPNGQNCSTSSSTGTTQQAPSATTPSNTAGSAAGAAPSTGTTKTTTP